MRPEARQRESLVEGDVTMLETILSDFLLWRNWWFDDKPKYRKIARLVNPSALHAYSQIADLRPVLKFLTFFLRLNRATASARDLNPGNSRHGDDFWVM